MTRSIVISRTVVQATGTIQLILGALFWAHIAKSLIPLHITIGSLFVLALLVLAVLCARAGAPPGMVALVVVWSVALPFVGIGQSDVLHGHLHWIIQVVHLLLGVIAIGLASIIAAQVRSAVAAPS